MTHELDFDGFYDQIEKKIDAVIEKESPGLHGMMNLMRRTMTPLEALRLRTRWQELAADGKPNFPPLDEDKYYGKRYSVPVLAGNVNTGQVWETALRWDYQMLDWVESTFPNGPDPEDYEILVVTHWALWPRLKLVCLD